MIDSNAYKREIDSKGFVIVDEVFSTDEIEKLGNEIEGADSSHQTFNKSIGIYAIRQFFKEVPSAKSLVFSKKFNNLIDQVFGIEYFVVKSIYFDKPEDSNWFVSYHQDLMISVDSKRSIDGFGPWVKKANRYSVQPPEEFLEANCIVRIHLDDTDEYNGALKILLSSHLQGIRRSENIDWKQQKEIFCRVKRGGIMIMKPLLFHASNRSTNKKRRRVIHLEFSNQELPAEMSWAERYNRKC